jgi:hypothetical protein
MTQSTIALTIRDPNGAREFLLRKVLAEREPC